jgi:hypothetical protein
MLASTTSKSDIVLALISIPVFAVTWISAHPAVEWLLGPMFQRTFDAGYADILPPSQVKLYVASLYMAQFLLSSLVAVVPLTVLAVLIPNANASRASVVFALIVAILLIGTRIKYMFSMPYIGASGGSVAVALLAGVALFTAGLAGSGLRVLTTRSTRTRPQPRAG